MKTTEQGRTAETAVADRLKSKGYEILAQNWRTRMCEIDLVVKKDKVIYFAEVKFRSQSSQGEGFEYITARKLKQMNFAAQVWCQENNWEGDWRLLAASVSGQACQQIEITEI